MSAPRQPDAVICTHRFTKQIAGGALREFRVGEVIGDARAAEWAKDRPVRAAGAAAPVGVFGRLAADLAAEAAAKAAAGASQVEPGLKSDALSAPTVEAGDDGAAAHATGEPSVDTAARRRGR